MVMDTLQGEEWGLREAVVSALVSIHNSVKTVTLKLAKTTGRQHYLSPRDYLDLIQKFVATEQEKRDRLEDLQIHIRTGLQKILETQDQVGSLRIEMVSKAEVLGIKDTESNQKLSQMVELQNEAEQRKVVAEQLTLELQTQNEEIRIRRESVEQELSEAEPSLLAAKQSVQNIRKAQLDEVRALARPPNAVRLTMEMVSLMIGEKNLEWIEIRKVIRRDDFIATIVNFNPLTLTSKQVKAVVEDYLGLAELDYASVDRASKACGPLYVWAESQIKYATILRRVKPLRDEVTKLQEKSTNLEIQQKETIQQVDELEGSIKQYKLEYATAIRDTETIRSEMDIVTKKVARAESLLLSLEEEKDRWQSTSISFDNQMSTLIGDCLIAAAFLTYAGIFDHRVRKNLKNEWSETLDILGIPYHTDLEIIGYLSNPSEQMMWRGYGLPSDELAMQNAILLERLNRYPLIIDPSGQATNFVIQKYSNRKIVQTSFLDSNFLKILASAIRFGTALLVSDVESIDPILNPVLNKELQKTGGRTLIRLGNEDIDFSPKFMIILSTRNPLAHFAPDLCSRVTMVNFTVTPASLEAQTLSAILKSERPDVDRRRTEVLRLQGEQNVKLRELEEALLNKISAVQGAILDDDTVINTLVVIKSEAAELNREVMKTQEIMNEVRIISNIYEQLAFAMSSVYFSLENLSDISFLYQFSLKFFMDIVNEILNSKIDNNFFNNSNNKSINVDIKESKIRVQSLTSIFYSEISRKVLRGLKFDDKLMFVVRLAQISTNGQEKKELNVIIFYF
jgi:dynein heavy chain 1